MSLHRNDERIPVAVLGATGSVGQRFIQLLADHPWFRVAELVASERSAGRRYGEIAPWRLSADLPEAAADLPVLDFDADLQSPLVFSALPGEVAGEIEERMARQGRALFSNSSAHRMDPDVPLLLAEVNPDHARAIEVQRANRDWSGFIVANSNCSAMHLVLALKPLQDAFGLEAVSVVTMQAVSGAGYPGVPSLDMIDNVVPFIPTEEEKMTEETQKILGRFDGAFTPADLVMTAQCNRVPVRDGHTECVSVRLGSSPAVEEVAAALANFTARPQEMELPSAPARPIVVRTEPNRPQPVLDRDTERGMASVVGRLRICPLLGYKFVVLGHNTVRGAAGASVLNAELLHAEGMLPL
ncbi:MAG: aspartate-semialdehyde dehydrogenase [Thermomicrobiales bacterium]|nr:aspartate-semialdehyde dehydrogenase [Thermomicrobiales bacterium]